MKNFLPLLLSLYFISCAGSKVEIRPENERPGEKQDTILILNKPQKLFDDLIYETETDTVIIPKRSKQAQPQQVILAPIVLPIMAIPFQSVAEKPKETIPEVKPETPKPKEEKPEQVKTEPIKLEPEIKEPKPPEISESETHFIQVGAFITESSAFEQLKKFKSLYPTYNAYIFFDSTSGFYKVLTDGFADSTEANKTLQIVLQNFTDAFVTSQKTLNVKQQTEADTSESLVKLQIGVYSNYENAFRIKEYVEKKFKIRVEVKKTDDIFKVFALLRKGDTEMLNEIKSEFTDAFEIKENIK